MSNISSSNICENFMISGSKDQKVVCACTIRLLILGPAKHEKVVVYAVNQQISNVCRSRMFEDFECLRLSNVCGFRMFKDFECL